MGPKRAGAEIAAKSAQEPKERAETASTSAQEPPNKQGRLGERNTEEQPAKEEDRPLPANGEEQPAKEEGPPPANGEEQPADNVEIKSETPVTEFEITPETIEWLRGDDPGQGPPHQLVRRAATTDVKPRAAVRVVGWDIRGWLVLSIEGKAPGDDGPPGVFDFVVAGKRLCLVQQRSPLTVFVNPDPQGMDEWEINGVRLKVGSPSVDEDAAPTEEQEDAGLGGANRRGG